jgi:glycosyltransferase involved in cell wall biosynthesis
MRRVLEESLSLALPGLEKIVCESHLARLRRIWNITVKVLFSNSLPFFLAHGGTQTLLESLMGELSNLGVEVEPERWWDETQSGDVIHYMNRPPLLNVQLARQKAFKVVMTENLDQTASRSPRQLLAQRSMIRLARALAPPGLLTRMGWEVYGQIDAMVYVVDHEWEVAQYLFGAKSDRGHVIPHGLDTETLRQLALPQGEEDYLVSMATIHPRKNSILLAQAAHRARTPVVFLGKPYAGEDPYFLEFKKWVDGKFVLYPGFVSSEEKWRYLRGARGFALLSQFESGCIAVYEAAAAGLPLLLSDLPWASKVYGKARTVKFVGLASVTGIATDLESFYASAHRQPGTTFPLLTWRQVAEKYMAIYRMILGQT